MLLQIVFVLPMLLCVRMVAQFLVERFMQMKRNMLKQQTPRAKELPLCSSQRSKVLSISTESQLLAEDEASKRPVALNADESVSEVEALLARWKQGRKVYYLVKWKGFPNNENAWQRRGDISDELVNKFDADYLGSGGNYAGVDLLAKRIYRGRTECLVKWEGRPDAENSWQRESTISRKRIEDFEADKS